MLKREFKNGDIVRIVNRWKNYSTCIGFFERHASEIPYEVAVMYKYGEFVSEEELNYKWEVKFVAEGLVVITNERGARVIDKEGIVLFEDY